MFRRIKRFLNIVALITIFLINMFGPFLVGDNLNMMNSWYGIPMFLTLVLWWCIGVFLSAKGCLKSFGIKRIGDIKIY